MKTDLHIAEGLALPIDFVTKTAAILAQRRKGKTYTASVLAEELVGAGQPWVAIDPTGAWWGLRASADGRSEGLPVRIIGGQHGDLPLEREAGRFVPQEKEGRGDTVMLGAFQAIVRRGGLHGLGTTLISQRPALVNKSVLTQLDILVLLRLVAGNDQDAVDKNYVSRSGTKEQRAELMGSLASLALGEAWIWEPGAEPPLYERVRVRERRTFNSSATPKPGEVRVEPKRFADVDIAALKEQMEAAIERAKADDPTELRKQIAQLKRELAARPADTVEVPGEVPVPYVPEALLDRLQDVEGHARAVLDDLASLEGHASGVLIDIGNALDVVKEAERDRPDVSRAGAAGGGARPVADRPGPGRAPQRPDPPQRREPSRPAVPRPAAASGLGERERRILTVLAIHGPRTIKQLPLQTGYSAKASTIRAGLSELRKYGYIEPGQPITITDAGLEALGDYEQLPTGPALLVWWHNKLGERERLILTALVDAYPNSLTNDEIAAATGYSPEASTIRAGMSNLRKLGLVEKWKAADDFMEAIR